MAGLIIQVQPGNCLPMKIVNPEDSFNITDLPKYLWVVERLLWRKSTLLTISIGVLDRDAY